MLREARPLLVMSQAALKVAERPPRLDAQRCHRGCCVQLMLQALVDAALVRGAGVVHIESVQLEAVVTRHEVSHDSLYFDRR